jgi:hypothetical protein
MGKAKQLFYLNLLILVS